MKPVRNPLNGNKTAIRSKFQSKKNGRTIYCESTLERDYAYIMEFDYGIGSFNEQPMRFTFFHDGRMRTYTPDFQVTFCDPLRIEIHEVKKLEYLKGPDVAARLAAAKLCIESQGYIFKTVTEVEIRRQPRLRNIGLALRYRDWDEAERPDLDQRLPVVDTAITLQALTTPHRWQSALPYLIDGRLLADLDHPLSAETKVWRP